MNASTALADAPVIVPIYGFFTDTDGAPIAGPHRLTFIVYDAETEGQALYTDDRRWVDIEGGQFVAGASAPCRMQRSRSIAVMRARWAV